MHRNRHVMLTGGKHDMLTGGKHLAEKQCAHAEMFRSATQKLAASFFLQAYRAAV
jgi:hypothetical protein